MACWAASVMKMNLTPIWLSSSQVMGSFSFIHLNEEE